MAWPTSGTNLRCLRGEVNKSVTVPDIWGHIVATVAVVIVVVQLLLLLFLLLLLLLVLVLLWDSAKQSQNLPSIQFSALHSRGSSHGSSRITRRAYDYPFYVKMMDEAFRMWSALEEESDTKLYEYVN